jgi:Major intrinsic protein
MNAARALGPALVQQDLTNWWIYRVGPVISGLLAAAHTTFWLKGSLARLPVRRSAPDAWRKSSGCASLRSRSGIRSLSLGAEKVMLRFAGLADTITTPQWRGADQ